MVREYVNGGQYIDEVILVANTVGASVTYNYYMTDLRYSVYGFLDSSGAVVERAKYDGYGKRTLTDSSYSIITTPVVDQAYGYTGIRHDTETGLQYYRARYFDNDLGRFINRDPIGYVDGFNLYRGYFIPNDTDWSGLDTPGLGLGDLRLIDERCATRRCVEGSKSHEIDPTRRVVEKKWDILSQSWELTKCKTKTTYECINNTLLKTAIDNRIDCISIKIKIKPEPKVKIKEGSDIDDLKVNPLDDLDLKSSEIGIEIKIRF